MGAFNLVRFRVKPDRQEDFLAAHREAAASWPGLKHANLIRTGAQGFCLIGEWDSEDALKEARPAMIKTLESFRDCLEPLGTKGAVSVAMSGPVVLEMK